MTAKEPEEFFEVVTTEGNKGGYYLTSKDGKNWERHEGTISLRVFYDEKQYPEVDEILNKFYDSIPEKEHHLKNRVFRLKHKLYGMKFHLDNFLEQELDKYQEFNKYCKGADHQSIIMDPKLIYEVESFLFQSKSCLDVLAQTIGIRYNLPGIHTYSNNGIKIINSLRQNSPANLKSKGNNLAEILESHKDWISAMVEMRDKVTHISDLEGFLCFIQYPWLGKRTSKIAYPSMPNGKRASMYVSETWSKMLFLIRKLTPLLYETP